MLTVYNSKQIPIMSELNSHVDRPVRSAKRTIKTHVKWTPEEQETLINAVQKFGTIWSNVAKDVGRTRGACIQKYEQLQMSKRPLKVSEFEFLLHLLPQAKKSRRLSWNKIGKIFNQHFSTQLDSIYLRSKYYDKRNTIRQYEKRNYTHVASITPPQISLSSPSLSKASSSFSSVITHSNSSHSNDQSLSALEVGHHPLPLPIPINPVSSFKSDCFLNSNPKKSEKIEITFPTPIEKCLVKETHLKKRKISIMNTLRPFTKNTRRVPKSELL